MKLQNERLTKLANFLNKIPAKHFSLEDFVNPNVYSYNRFEGIFRKDSKFINEFKLIMKATFEEVMTNISENFTEEPNCGTTACAIGWCPKIFPEYFSWSESLTSVVLTVDNNEYSNFLAAEVFFGLRTIESYYLFHPLYYKQQSRSAKHVARRIKYVVRNGFPKKMKRYDK